MKKLSLVLSFLLISVAGWCVPGDICPTSQSNIGAALRYQDDKSIAGYSDMTFTYNPNGCTLDSHNLLQDKRVGPGYYMAHSFINADDGGMKCGCLDKTMSFTFANSSRNCTFKIVVDKSRNPESFEGTCIMAEDKQRVIKYEPMTTSPGSEWALLNLDKPIQFHRLPKK